MSVDLLHARLCAGTGHRGGGRQGERHTQCLCPIRILLLHMLCIWQVKRVFASLANGTLCVFSRKSISMGEHMPTGDAELISAACTIKCAEEQFQQEAEDWAEPLILRLGESGKAAKCVTFVGDKQLWCGCGNTITVIDSKELRVLKHIPVFVRRMALVNELVSNGTRVWGVGRQLACVMEWDVETFTLIHIFKCNNIDPTDENIISDPKLVEDLIDPDSLYKRTSLTAEQLKPDTSEGFNVQNDTLKVQATSTPFSQRTTRMTLRGIRPRVRNMENQTTIIRKRITSTRDIVLRKHLGSTRTTSLVIVDATLWVGRGMGDVLVVDIAGKEQHGKVLARLSAGQCEKYGNRSYNKLVNVAGEYVVSSQWLEPVNVRKNTGPREGGEGQGGHTTHPGTGWQVGKGCEPMTHQAITVWKAWNRKKISEFMSRRSAMHMLEEDTRD